MSTAKTTSRRGPSEFRDPHLEHRKAQERSHFEGGGGAQADAPDPMASLITLELNLTELCNRKCVFCPRIDPEVYPNRNLNMEVGLAEKVAGDVATLGLKSRISFSGFGEPLLHKGFTEIVRRMRGILPDNTIETNTNGDRLTPAKINELYDAGLTYLYVNLYDGPEQRPHFEAMFAEAGADPARWRLRPHWVGSEEDYGLTLNNRSGVLKAPGIDIGPLETALAMRCHYPFYKMLIDWNGDVLFCSNDWGREIVVGNVMQTGLREVWLSERMFEVRRRLANGDRGFKPCANCNVHGTLHGVMSFALLVRHYEREGRIPAGEVALEAEN
jgi:radical SAM protein with 4Fe4S-binding SPASM domain